MRLKWHSETDFMYFGTFVVVCALYHVTTVGDSPAGVLMVGAQQLCCPALRANG